jgi:hypothetical protein
VSIQVLYGSMRIDVEVDFVCRLAKSWPQCKLDLKWLAQYPARLILSLAEHRRGMNEDECEAHCRLFK